MKTYRLNDHDGPGGLIVADPAHLKDEIEACSAEESPLFIFIEDMDEEAFRNLPEFDGF